MITRDQYIECARDIYVNDDCEIDDDARLSEADNGSWVSAWVWVCDEYVVADAKAIP